MASDEILKVGSCIQDPNFAVLCSFFENYSSICGIPPPSFVELQQMIDNRDEISPQLIDLQIRLLRKARKNVAPDKWERALARFCWASQPNDCWLLEQKGYKFLNSSQRIQLLLTLIGAQFDQNSKFKNDVNKMDVKNLRMEPVGKDKYGHNYWAHMDTDANIRVYKEDLDDEKWDLIASGREELVRLINDLLKGRDPNRKLEEIPLNDEPVDDEERKTDEMDNLPIEQRKVLEDERDGTDCSSESSHSSYDDNKDGEYEVTRTKRSKITKLKSAHENSVQEKISGTILPSQRPITAIAALKALDKKSFVQHIQNLDSHNMLKPLLADIKSKNTCSNSSSSPAISLDSLKSKIELAVGQTDISTVSTESSLKSQPGIKLEQILKSKLAQKLAEAGSNEANSSVVCKKSEDNVDRGKLIDGASSLPPPPHNHNVAEAVEKQSNSVSADEGSKESNDSVKNLTDTAVENDGEIEEPVMIVSGVGNGQECNCGSRFESNDDDEIVEDVMFVYGVGNGADCCTGNEDDTSKHCSSTSSANVRSHNVNDILKNPEDLSAGSNRGEELCTAACIEEEDKSKKPKLWTIDAICSSKPDQKNSTADAELFPNFSFKHENNETACAAATVSSSYSIFNLAEKDNDANQLQSAAPTSFYFGSNNQNPCFVSSESGSANSNHELLTDRSSRDVPSSNVENHNTLLHKESREEDSVDTEVDQLVKNGVDNVINEAVIKEIIDTNHCKEPEESSVLEDSHAPSSSTAEIELNHPEKGAKASLDRCEISRYEMARNEEPSPMDKPVLGTENVVEDDNKKPKKEHDQTNETDNGFSSIKLFPESTLNDKQNVSNEKVDLVPSEVNLDVELVESLKKSSEQNNATDVKFSDMKSASESNVNILDEPSMQMDIDFDPGSKSTTFIAKSVVNTDDAMEVGAYLPQEAIINPNSKEDDQLNKLINASAKCIPEKKLDADHVLECDISKSEHIPDENSQSNTLTHIQTNLLVDIVKEPFLKTTNLLLVDGECSSIKNEILKPVDTNESKLLKNDEISENENDLCARNEILKPVHIIDSKSDKLDEISKASDLPVTDDDVSESESLKLDEFSKPSVTITMNDQLTKIDSKPVDIIDTKFPTKLAEESELSIQSMQSKNSCHIELITNNLPVIATEPGHNMSDSEIGKLETVDFNSSCQVSKKSVSKHTEKTVNLSEIPNTKNMVSKILSDLDEQPDLSDEPEPSIKQSKQLNASDELPINESKQLNLSDESPTKECSNLEPVVVAVIDSCKNDEKNVSSELNTTGIEIMKKDAIAKSTDEKLKIEINDVLDNANKTIDDRLKNVKNLPVNSNVETPITKKDVVEEPFDENSKNDITEKNDNVIKTRRGRPKRDQVVPPPLPPENKPRRGRPRKSGVEDTVVSPVNIILTKTRGRRMTPTHAPVSKIEVRKGKKGGKDEEKETDVKINDKNFIRNVESPSKIALKKGKKTSIVGKIEVEPVSKRGRNALKQTPQKSTSKSEPVDIVKKSATGKKQQSPKKRRGWGEVDVSNIENSSSPGVRQSRRLAQLKISEQVTEKTTPKKEKAENKKNSAQSLSKKGVKLGKKFVTYQAEEEGSEDGIKSIKKGKTRRKRKKGLNNVSIKKFDPKKVWQETSKSSSEEEDEEEEEEEHYEEEEELAFVSDHEFSPESDVEDTEYTPVKRARTAHSKPEDVDKIERDESCKNCGKADQPEWILLCDECDEGWHASCLKPPVMAIPEGDWFCPPCQHIKLIAGLQRFLQSYDSVIKKKANEVLRKKRLEYVGISIANMIKERPRARTEIKQEKSSKSSESEEESSSSSDEPMYQLRVRRQTNLRSRLNEYDKLINSAIQGEDFAKIKPAKCERSNLGKDNENTPSNSSKKPSDTQVTGARDEADNEREKDYDEEKERMNEKKSKGDFIFSGVRKVRKKSVRLTNLDASSEDDHYSDEDFKGTSAEEPEDEDSGKTDTGSDDSTYRPVRRSSRAITRRYDKDFINDDSEDEEDDNRNARKKKKRLKRNYSDSGSEEDSTWGRKRKRSKLYQPFAGSQSKKRKRGIADDSDEDFSKRKNRNKKVKYGLDEDFPQRRTRGKKISYVDHDSSNSEEESEKSKKTLGNASEDEYKDVDDHEDNEGTSGSGEEDNEDETGDDGSSGSEGGMKSKNMRRKVIESDESDSINDDNPTTEDRKSPAATSEKKSELAISVSETVQPISTESKQAVLETASKQVVPAAASNQTVSAAASNQTVSVAASKHTVSEPFSKQDVSESPVIATATISDAVSPISIEQMPPAIPLANITENMPVAIPIADLPKPPGNILQISPAVISTLEVISISATSVSSDTASITSVVKQEPSSQHASGEPVQNTIYPHLSHANANISLQGLQSMTRNLATHPTNVIQGPRPQTHASATVASISNSQYRQGHPHPYLNQNGVPARPEIMYQHPQVSAGSSPSRGPYPMRIVGPHSMPYMHLRMPPSSSSVLNIRPGSNVVGGRMITSMGPRNHVMVGPNPVVLGGPRPLPVHRMPQQQMPHPNSGPTLNSSPGGIPPQEASPITKRRPRGRGKKQLEMERLQREREALENTISGRGDEDLSPGMQFVNHPTGMHPATTPYSSYHQSPPFSGVPSHTSASTFSTTGAAPTTPVMSTSKSRVKITPTRMRMPMRMAEPGGTIVRGIQPIRNQYPTPQPSLPPVCSTSPIESAAVRLSGSSCAGERTSPIAETKPDIKVTPPPTMSVVKSEPSDQYYHQPQPPVPSSYPASQIPSRNYNQAPEYGGFPPVDCKPAVKQEPTSPYPAPPTTSSTPMSRSAAITTNTTTLASPLSHQSPPAFAMNLKQETNVIAPPVASPTSVPQTPPYSQAASLYPPQQSAPASISHGAPVVTSSPSPHIHIMPAVAVTQPCNNPPYRGPGPAALHAPNAPYFSSSPYGPRSSPQTSCIPHHSQVAPFNQAPSNFQLTPPNAVASRPADVLSPNTFKMSTSNDCGVTPPTSQVGEDYGYSAEDEIMATPADCNVSGEDQFKGGSYSGASPSCGAYETEEEKTTEDASSGEFGGLVTYFSSQREYDMDE